MEIAIDSLPAESAATVLLMAEAQAPAAAPAGKNPKRAKRLYPLQPAGRFTPAPPPRNAGCPCGSGKKFKRCHGAWPEDET